MVELHDAFTVGELLHYEALGLCGGAKAGASSTRAQPPSAARSRSIRRAGCVRAATPPAPPASHSSVELAWQLRGTAGPRQVAGARVAIAQCQGGVATAAAPPPSPSSRGEGGAMAEMGIDYFFLRRALRQHAVRTALVANGRRITYRDLDRRSRRLAAAFAGIGLGLGDRLALLLGVTPSFFETEIAAAKAGLVKVPVNTRLSPREIVQTLRLCSAKAVIADPPFAAAIADARVELPELKVIILKPRGARRPPRLRRHCRRQRELRGRRRGSRRCLFDALQRRHDRRAQGHRSHPSRLCRDRARGVADVGRGGRALAAGHHSAHGANFTWPALLAEAPRSTCSSATIPARCCAIAAERLTRVPMVPSMWYGVLDHPEMRTTDWSSVRTWTCVRHGGGRRAPGLNMLKN